MVNCGLYINVNNTISKDKFINIDTDSDIVITYVYCKLSTNAGIFFYGHLDINCAYSVLFGGPYQCFGQFIRAS